MDDKTIIQVKNLKKYYGVGGSTVKALDGADLCIKAGEFICIAGRSGSGKSTLLNLLAGLEQPTEGSIEVLGQHIENMSEEERTRFRRQHMGFVFQSYNNLPQYTALENVALPLAVRGIALKERTELAMQALEKVGLKDHALHRPSQLSGGQQQRISIARAIITGPSIVLADEPTGNLDTNTGKEIMELLCGMFRKNGTTFIISSHDPSMALCMDRTIHFRDGKIDNGEDIQSEV